MTYLNEYWRPQPHLIQAVLAPPPFCSRRLTTNHDVREELRHPDPVRIEWTEIRLGLLLQLHQPLLRHRPVQRRRILCRPQLGEGGTEPAAGARPAAGLSGKWNGVKRGPQSAGGCGGGHSEVSRVWKFLFTVKEKTMFSDKIFVSALRLWCSAKWQRKRNLTSNNFLLQLNSALKK